MKLITLLLGCALLLPPKIGVVGRLSDGEGVCSATAVRVGVWITENHCWNDGMAMDGKVVKWLKWDERLDLALFAAPTGEVVKLAKTEPKEGEEVWVEGVPGGWQGAPMRLKRTLVQRGVGFFDWGPRNLFEPGVAKGMSGGGVFNRKRELVGVVEGGAGFVPGVVVMVSQPLSVIRRFLSQ